MNMNGQWTGRYTGTNTGELVLDMDDMQTHYEGRALVYDDRPGLPPAFAFIRTPDKADACELTLSVQPLDPRTLEPTSWETISNNNQGVAFPTSARVNLSLSDGMLRIEATTDIGTQIAASIPRSRAGEPTEYIPLAGVTNWSDFKNYVGGLETNRYIFRGQKEQQRLRTSFHRTGRADITRFQSNDIRTLHRHLSARTKHLFNLLIPDENGAFFSLVQHHGYPTPLLDWTMSPFVAAFFAYRFVTNADAASAINQKVRIFLFDAKLWREHFPQFPMLRPFGLHLSIIEFLAVENERLIPQQSVSTVTNVDDIETYIHDQETRKGCTYLQIIDLPWRERLDVMRDLSVMGITAGSLFPGLDGACEELRERFF